MAAIFFLFLDAKKLPKKPEFVSDESACGLLGLAARGGCVLGGRGLPVFGSTCVGLPALLRSLMMLIA